MKIVIDISKDKYDEIMSMDWKNCRLIFDEELRAIHDGKVLEQKPSSSENPNKWITCSERLPETTDYYLVTVGINEYGLMIPSVRTALYNTKTKDFTVHAGANMCIVGDVIAWCDCLPEPYQSEIPTGSRRER